MTDSEPQKEKLQNSIWINLKEIWKLAGKQRGFFWQSWVIILLMAVVNLPLPLLNKVTIDHLIPAGDQWMVYALAIFAFTVRGLASAFQVFQNFLVRQVMCGMGYDMRSKMLRALLEAPFPKYPSGDMASMIARLGNEVPKTEGMVFDTVRFVIRPAAMLFVMLIAMLMLSPLITLVTFVCTPLCFIPGILLRQRIWKQSERTQKLRQKVQYQVSDALDNIRAIRCFQREDRYRNKIQERIDEFTEESVDLAMTERLIQALLDTILLIPWLVITVVGAWQVQAGAISLGDLTTFLIFNEFLLSPLAQIVFYCSQLKAKLVSYERIQELSDIPSDRKTGQVLSSPARSLSLKNIDFRYPNTEKNLFTDLSMNINAGQRVAIVGPSGAGKSSLVQILLGFYPIQSGQICMEGQDVNELGTDNYRQQLGVVFQDNPMFDGSIRFNLCFDAEFNDEEIWQALEASEAADFVRSLPEQLETRIGTRGLKLSGGQRQRLAIARVMLKNPGIILMDEATSSLDSLTEQRIQQALDQLLSGRTSITIAHRLSTVVNSDRILYLDKGTVIEDGSHQELLEKRGAYYDLFKLQTDGLI